MPHPGGRPSEYTQEIADKICAEISLGKSVRAITRQDDMPDQSTVFRWLRERPEFRKQYDTSMEFRTEAQLEMLNDIGDEAIKHSQEVDFKASNAVVSAYKLKADNMKWVMSKMKPKKYGDKVDVTTDGKALPTPLLHVLHNDSNKENSESNQTN